MVCLYVFSGVALLSANFAAMQNPKPRHAIVIGITYVWLLIANVIYAVAEQQYAFMVMPVVLIVFSLSFRKVVTHVTNNS